MVSRRISPEIISFLLEGDHAVRWQTLSDLVDGKPEDIHYERMMMEIEGWGAELLDLQADNGLWYESLMINHWRSTIWVLAILRRLGMYPMDTFMISCQKILDESLSFNGGIRAEGTKNEHPCLSGLVLAICCYFRYIDPRIESIFHYLIETQSADGSWVCPHHTAPKKHRFLTTLLVLEGLMEYQKLYPRDDSYIRNLQYEGHQFLLSRHLFRPELSSTMWMTSALTFPFPVFHYDILTVLDYFRKMQFMKEPQMDEALINLRQMGNNYRFVLDESEGEMPIKMEPTPAISRYNTLRAIRVLQYYEYL